jgi:ribosomal protein S12 methylthiotransferase accessory factor
MEMKVTFPGNLRVDAEFGGYTVRTDQPRNGGGDGSAPTPFSVFLASIATCAGIYVLGFLKQRGFSTEDAGLTMVPVTDPFTGMVAEIRINVDLPAGFPDKYRDAIVRAVNQCAVKKHMEQPPEFTVTTSVAVA